MSETPELPFSAPFRLAGSSGASLHMHIEQPDNAFMRLISSFVTLLLLPASAPADEAPAYLAREKSWYSTVEGQNVIANIISWQNADGGWDKAYDAATRRPEAVTPASRQARRQSSTIDNDATTSELLLLARATTHTGNEIARTTFDRGIEYLLEAQYRNGGWPQRFPLQKNYGRYITFNDAAMVNVLELSYSISSGGSEFEFVDESRRKRCAAAFERGIECILRCQITVQGELTGWCQQHDELTLAPVGARSFELPGIASYETCRIILLLMKIERPSLQVKKAVHAGVTWLDRSKFLGKRLVRKLDPARPGEQDAEFIDDPAAPPTWARFYDIDTNRPFFCGRDGQKKWSMAEIESERRGGYAWYGSWGTKVLDRYGKWSTTNAE